MQQLQELTRDLPESDRAVAVGPSGVAAVTLPMHSNDIVLISLKPR